MHWATGVARGMSYLHENDVVHRDLKSANGNYSDITLLLFCKCAVIRTCTKLICQHVALWRIDVSDCPCSFADQQEDSKAL